MFEVDVVSHAMGVVVKVSADALQALATLALELVVCHMCGLPQVAEGVEQIEDLGHVRKRLGQVHPAGPPRARSVG